jgi:hypothetical protein
MDLQYLIQIYRDESSFYAQNIFLFKASKMPMHKYNIARHLTQQIVEDANTGIPNPLLSVDNNK